MGVLRNNNEEQIKQEEYNLVAELVHDALLDVMFQKEKLSDLVHYLLKCETERKYWEGKEESLSQQWRLTADKTKKEIDLQTDLLYKLEGRHRVLKDYMVRIEADQQGKIGRVLSLLFCSIEKSTKSTKKAQKP